VHQLLKGENGLHVPSPSVSYAGLAQEMAQMDKKNGSLPWSDGQHESRLLTKKQISDMALEIRELAKKLSHLQLKMSVQNVFILAKAHDEGLIHNTREVAEWLMVNNGRYKVYVFQSCKLWEVRAHVGQICRGNAEEQPYLRCCRVAEGTSRFQRTVEVLDEQAVR
jgi:NAD+ kinase